MKARAKHTPGPWTAEERDERILIWSDGSHDYLAALSLDADGADEEVADAYADERQANARLIAAAPDLLAACEAALRVCNLSGTGERDRRAAIAKLEAAVAKARGEDLK